MLISRALQTHLNLFSITLPSCLDFEVTGSRLFVCDSIHYSSLPTKYQYTLIGPSFGNIFVGKCAVEVTTCRSGGASYVRVYDQLTGSVDEMKITDEGDWFTMVDMSDCSLRKRYPFSISWMFTQNTDPKNKNRIGIEVVHKLVYAPRFYVFAMGCGYRSIFASQTTDNTDCITFTSKLFGESSSPMHSA